MSEPLIMSIPAGEPLPADCDGCSWSYHGDGGPWRLTRINPACPVHGHELARPADDAR